MDRGQALAQKWKRVALGEEREPGVEHDKGGNRKVIHYR